MCKSYGNEEFGWRPHPDSVEAGTGWFASSSNAKRAATIFAETVEGTVSEGAIGWFVYYGEGHIMLFLLNGIVEVAQGVEVAS